MITIKELKSWFSKFTNKIVEWSGSIWASLLSLILVIGWLLGGLWFGYGTLYQLYANTGTTLICFIMVFLIQNAQNRESKATQIKLDELILSKRSADNCMIQIETLSDEELDKLREKIMEKLHHLSSSV